MDSHGESVSHEPISSSQHEDRFLELMDRVPTDSSSHNEDMGILLNKDVNTRKKRKTSSVWIDFDEIELKDGGKKAVCMYCKNKFSTGGKCASTSHLRRHSESCLQKKLHQARHRQTTIPYQKSSSAANPFLTLNAKYSNEKMREIIATAIMVHEEPFSIVENTVWMWAFQYGNPEFQKFSRKTAKNDCIALYEAEKRTLKALLKSVNRISITTDMWRSSHQIAEYMVITGHFIDSEWNLQKRVLSFMKVPAPRRGIDVADAIFNCLQSWEIEKKIFSVSVDNASYNDSCIRSLKDTLSRSNSLILGGKLFHVRCCAHILNLLVQDGLSEIKGIIENVRESVKYINHSDSRLNTFCDIVKQMQLKERKLIIDCPTRWNSTYEMLSTASKFKDVFPGYKEREPHYNYLPSYEDWEKVEKICHILETFNLATHVISGSDYPTANLYLAEVYRVKEVIDAAVEDTNDFMRRMARKMKEKFDKYWGERNLLMAIASVLDPMCKFHVVDICFPIIYREEFEAKKNVEKVQQALRDLYDEYLTLSEDSSGDVDSSSTNSSSTSASQTSVASGFAKILSMVRQKEAILPVKSELQTYLEEGVYLCDDSSFSAFEWWKSNNMKYKILSKMAADILAIPISTVASESTFSAGGRVIDAYRASLAEDTIQALICGGDWLRNKYGLKRKQKDDPELEEIKLQI